MLRTLKTCMLVGALVMATAPARAAILTLPIIGDIERPDMDPFHVMAPEAPAAAAPATKAKTHHKMKKRMTRKKKM